MVWMCLRTTTRLCFYRDIEIVSCSFTGLNRKVPESIDMFYNHLILANFRISYKNAEWKCKDVHQRHHVTLPQQTMWLDNWTNQSTVLITHRLKCYFIDFEMSEPNSVIKIIWEQSQTIAFPNIRHVNTRCEDCICYCISSATSHLYKSKSHGMKTVLHSQKFYVILLFCSQVKFTTFRNEVNRNSAINTTVSSLSCSVDSAHFDNMLQNSWIMNEFDSAEKQFHRRQEFHHPAQFSSSFVFIQWCQCRHIILMNTKFLFKK